MPQGKPAGVSCVQLDERLRCRLFGRPERPAVCASLRPSPAMCNTDRDQALRGLAALERATAPARAATAAEAVIIAPACPRPGARIRA